MAVDPRKNLAKACGPGGNPDLISTEKSEFFRNIGKIGDLEILNEVNNEIGEGLRALETISNQVRIGGAVPAVFDPTSEASQEQGEDAVTEAVTIDPTVARTTAFDFSPAVANRALGQAGAIYDRIKQGNFEVRDFPEALQDFGNLKQLIDGIYQPPAASTRDKSLCDPSPYARDLIALAPKHKFMFVVEFVFSTPYQYMNTEDFAFVIKRTTRPNITFEYEDINYYNFRTKVLKKSEYQNMQMTFYDDMIDNTLRFYNNYLRVISPISTDETVGDGKGEFYEEAGMTFNINEAVNSASSRQVSTIDNPNVKTIIDHIKLYHIIEAGQFVDTYIFDNPRLAEMNLDELDMTDGSAGTEVTIGFNFDGLSITPRSSMKDALTGGHIGELTSGGIYPIKSRQSSDSLAKDAEVPPVPGAVEAALGVVSGVIGTGQQAVANALQSVEDFFGG